MTVVTAIIPAYNETTELAHAVRGLHAQTRRPDRIILALNNATAPCVAAALNLAVTHGIDVWDLGHCPGLKAQALNRAIARLRDTNQLSPDAHLLVTDADTTLTPNWIATALDAAKWGDTLVGGIFLGDPDTPGWLARCQRTEYARYAREVYAHGDTAWVLTGTATLIPTTAITALYNSRGYVYDEQVATEDFELTVAAARLGYMAVSPPGCEVVTEVMTTVRGLLDQRTRWYRGAVETLRLHGLTRVTGRYYRQQALIAAGAVLSWVAVVLIVATAWAGHLAWSPWWLLAVVPVMARLVASPHRAHTALLVPDLVYDVMLQVALARGWWQAFTRTGRAWNPAEQHSKEKRHVRV